MAPAEPAPVSAFDLNPEVLGVMLIRLAVRAGHSRLSSTAGYAAPMEGSGKELEFLQDVLKMSAQQLAEKWYGGTAGAMRFSARLTGQALSAVRHPRVEAGEQGAVEDAGPSRKGLTTTITRTDGPQDQA